MARGRFRRRPRSWGRRFRADCRVATSAPSRSSRRRKPGCLRARRTRKPARQTPHPRGRSSSTSASVADKGRTTAGRGGRVERTLTFRCHSARLSNAAIAQPVDFAQRNRAGRQRLFRPDDHLPQLGVQPHHIKRIVQPADAQPLALSDRVMDHAAMLPQHMCRPDRRYRPDLRHRGAAFRSRPHSCRWARSRCPDCRACRPPTARISPPAPGFRPWRPDAQAESADSPAALPWSRTGNSFDRGSASVAMCNSAPAARFALDVMAGGHAIGVQILRRGQQILELHPLIAADAGHRGCARQIGIGEFLDHRLAEGVFVIQHIMRKAHGFGHARAHRECRARHSRRPFLASAAPWS